MNRSLRPIHHTYAGLQQRFSLPHSIIACDAPPSNRKAVLLYWQTPGAGFAATYNSSSTRRATAVSACLPACLPRPPKGHEGGDKAPTTPAENKETARQARRKAPSPQELLEN